MAMHRSDGNGAAGGGNGGGPEEGDVSGGLQWPYAVLRLVHGAGIGRSRELPAARLLDALTLVGDVPLADAAERILDAIHANRLFDRLFLAELRTSLRGGGEVHWYAGERVFCGTDPKLTRAAIAALASGPLDLGIAVSAPAHVAE